VPLPTNWATIPVAGRYVLSDGTAASGTVTFSFTPYLRNADEDVVIVPKPVQVVLDSNGAFATTLPATDDPDVDPQFHYTVTENIGGVVTAFSLLVPKDTVGTLQLADVDRNATLPNPPEIYVRTVNGMYGDVEIDLSGGGGTPASSVVSGTSFGQATAVGVSTDYARADHSHGTPAAPADDSSTQRVRVAKAGTLVGTRRELNLIEGSNVTMTVADNAGANRVDVTINSAGGGGGGTPAGSVVAETSYGQASAVGVGTNYAREDHTHGTPALPTPAAIGAVPTTRTITTSTGLTGGGDLSANRTLSVVDNTTTQRVEVADGGSLIGTRKRVNFVDGTYTTVTAVDNAGSDRVDVTVEAEAEPAPVTLTYAATIATDCANKRHGYFRVTLTGGAQLQNPTNAVDGGHYTWEIIQDATGGRVLTYGTQFAFGSDIADGTLSTGAAKRDFIRTIYNASAAKHFVVGFSRGY
jgi:hypothetical protein